MVNIICFVVLVYDTLLQMSIEFEK